MFDYKIGISEEEHDTFVIQHPQVNLLQSSSWAKIKDNWGNERLGFYKNGELVAVASILIKKLPLGYTMMYIPRGPIMDYQDILIEPVLSEKATVLRENGKYVFKVIPQATKIQVKEAVGRLFGVKVERCTVMNVKGKNRRVRYKMGKTSSWKKAIVTLSKGEVIKIFEGA